MSDETIAFARESSAWPFQEAKTLLDKRLKGKTPDKGYVLFETGYGPSGLPHIGTFGEVARTTWVRRAFEILAPDIPTKLFAFSDDMDGLRKVPDNIPNKEMVGEHLGKPLTRVPDPFGTHESFGHHNNARLRGFLDSFGFQYDFKSATDCYTSGQFDAALLRVLEMYDEVCNVVLPTLGEDRRATYSPFMPLCPRTGQVLMAKVVERDLASGSLVYQDPETGEYITTPVTGGACKLQWKADWGTRWYALGVDYEMSGKDLIPSVELSSKICRILGGTPPLNLTYELFLDDKGQKISKSKGNGLSMEDWLKYAPAESLGLFMFQKPKAAKRLYFDVIPKTVDDYLTFVGKIAEQDGKALFDNPAWHIHNGKPPAKTSPLPFALLLNLVGVCHSDDPAVLWHYISRYAPSATPESEPLLDTLVRYAIVYYSDFVKPNKTFRLASEAERGALTALRDVLAAAPEGASGSDLQDMVYAVGKDHEDLFPSLRDWFKAQYEILLGQEQGPRMGSFFALYGVPESIALLQKAIDGESLAG
jgi:lysyl-tRNA synthetase class 1